MLSTKCLGTGLELNYLSKLLVPSEGRNHSLRHRVLCIWKANVAICVVEVQCTLKNRVHFKNRDRRKQKPLAKVVEFFKIKTFS